MARTCTIGATTTQPTFHMGKQGKQKAPRPRTLRRAADESRRRLEDKLVRLAEDLPGGSPARPIAVASASVIEVRARGLSCWVCRGDLELKAHLAAGTAEEPLRCVELSCRGCRRSRQAWFRVEPPMAN